jgi:hypothetical protein
VDFQELVQALGDAVIVADPEGRVQLRVTGIAAVVRDETARWAEEQARRKRLAELERGARPA